MRVLSGVQPTGPMHWGNYFGAVRQYIDLQHGNEAYYFIANLHALTTVRDREQLAAYTLGVATDLLALGLDPQKANLFVQSRGRPLFACMMAQIPRSGMISFPNKNSFKVECAALIAGGESFQFRNIFGKARLRAAHFQHPPSTRVRSFNDPTAIPNSVQSSNVSQ